MATANDPIDAAFIAEGDAMLICSTGPFNFSNAVLGAGAPG